MGIGIFKKMKNAFKAIGGKVKDFAQKAIKALPQVIGVGKQVLDRVKPITQFIPGVGQVVDSLDKGFTIGKSILDQV